MGASSFITITADKPAPSSSCMVKTPSVIVFPPQKRNRRDSDSRDGAGAPILRPQASRPPHPQRKLNRKNAKFTTESTEYTEKEILTVCAAENTGSARFPNLQKATSMHSNPGLTGCTGF